MTDRDRRSRRGGRRQPRNPAPVSGPGALSRRTDGGPASPDVVNPAEGNFGQRQALLQQRSAAPITPDAASGGATPGAGAPTPPSPRTPVPGVPALAPDDPRFNQNIFGRATDRPNEPITAGARTTRVLPEDPNALLRMMYRRNPDPRIQRMFLR